MKKYIIIILAIISVLCACAALSACGGDDGEVYSTLEMNSMTVYLTDFSLQYTSSEESPYGDIDSGALSDSKIGSIQSYYYVLEFDIQMLNDNSSKEWLTVELTVLDADIVGTVINYANTSSTAAVTENGRTTITAKYSLPDKARLIKNAQLIVELKPQTEGSTDIYYSITSDTKTVTGYDDDDTTVIITSDTVSLSKTSLNYRLNSGNTYYVSGIGTKKGGNIYVRTTYKGLPVTGIGDSAFSGDTTITGITMPQCIAYVGASAFSDCISLEYVKLSDCEASLSASAFSGCTCLSDISLGDYIISIGELAFYNTAYYNNSENWENGVLYIGAYLITSDTSISVLSIKDGTLLLASHAFDGCNLITDITIPDSVSIICSYAFNECTSVTSVTIGSGVTSIGGYAFYNLTALTSINYNAIAAEDLSVAAVNTYSENYAFTAAGQGADGITVNIGSGVTIIPCGLFCPEGVGRYTLTYPKIIKVVFADGSSCEEIGRYAFAACRELTEINIPSGVTSIGNFAFSGCTALESITLPDGLTEISRQIFSSCTALKSITIPQNVKKIGDYAFSGCTALESIIFQDSASTWGCDGANYDISDPVQNVTYFTETYKTLYWYKRS